MRTSQISAIASNDSIRLSKISYDQKTPSNIAHIINDYLNGSNDTYTRIEGKIQVRSDSNFKIAIVGSRPESEDTETIFSLIDEIGDVKTFHVFKRTSKINILDFYIPFTAKKIQILTATKFQDGKISNISCYEFLVEKEPPLFSPVLQA